MNAIRQTPPRKVRRTTGTAVMRACALLTLLAASFGLGAADAQVWSSAADVARAADGAGASVLERRTAADVYARRSHTLVWTTPSGALTSAAQAVLMRLREAESHGLWPDDYLTPAIRTAIESGATGEAARTRRDVAITVAALRYMRHLHLGRVDPRDVGLRLETWAEPHDFAQVLTTALDRHDVGPALDRLAPPWPTYVALRAERRRYRAMPDTAWTTPLAVTPSVRAGEPLAAAPVVRARLLVLGDAAPGGDEAPPGSFTPALAAAVQQFQRRHGLAADGVLGARTVAALNVPPAARLRQIDVALERLRWLPDLGTRRVIAVNIPMFRLWAWNSGPLEVPPALTMDVIVGRAMRTQTPVFVAALDRVIFRPYWNVPGSIVHGEILPAIARDAGYLARQQMEIVRGPGDDAAIVPPTPEALEQVRAGTLRLRQRPGPHNALGLVKFVFPNAEHVYMHGTPAPALFAHARRDFSHGCIRVADPAGLASWVLQDLPAWTGPRIEAAMAHETPQQVDLPSPIDVVLFYLTAAVVPDDGQLHFADDLYGHDARLAAALARRAR